MLCSRAPCPPPPPPPPPPRAPHRRSNVRDEQSEKDPNHGRINLPSNVFGCGYCVCDFCKTPARNLSDYLPVTASPSLDGEGIPRHGLNADGIVAYEDGSDEMWPKWCAALAPRPPPVVQGGALLFTYFTHPTSDRFVNTLRCQPALFHPSAPPRP